MGRQGTGKSLVAQSLYFFEELPFLAAFVEAAEHMTEPLAPETIIRRALDQLRSHERAFGTFANPSVHIEWTRSFPFIVDGKCYRSPFKFAADARNRVVRPDSRLRDFVSAVQATVDPPRRHAVFLPTERLVISQLRSAIAGKVLALPVTYTLFADWMDQASRALTGLHAGAVPLEHEWIEQRGREALSGEVVRRGDQWKWRFGSKKASLSRDSLVSEFHARKPCSAWCGPDWPCTTQAGRIETRGETPVKGGRPDSV